MSVIEKKARDISRPILESIGRRLHTWGLSPDLITNVGLVLTLGVAPLLAWGHIRLGGVLLAVASVCDALDGTLARISDKESRFGAFLDSTIDRFEEAIVLLGLTIYYARTGGVWQVALIFVAVVGSLMVSYTRARAEALGVACKGGFMTRPVRVGLLIVALVLALPGTVEAALILIAVLGLLTSLQRIYHVWRATGGEAGGWGPVSDPFELTPPSRTKADET
jgi:CDP-diacylglycerol--glycerol-3-phosphate 3-phosphatidyltransferase